MKKGCTCHYTVLLRVLVFSSILVFSMYSTLQTANAQNSDSTNFDDPEQIIKQIQNMSKQVNDIQSNIKKIEQLKSDIQKLRNDLTAVNETAQKTKDLDSKCNACIKKTEPSLWNSSLVLFSILSIVLGFLGGLGGWYINNKSKSRFDGSQSPSSDNRPSNGDGLNPTKHSKHSENIRS